MKSLIRLLSSVRLAIVLFILITAASILGTLLTRYNLYRTPAYLSLLLLFALNIIICTLTRSLPRLRRTLKPSWDWTAADLAAVPESRTFRLDFGLERGAAAFREAFARRRYRTREIGREGTILYLARKKTLGGFGSDIVHIGLLAILAGGILSGLLSRRADLVLTRGKAAEVPFAAFQVRLEDFQTEYYPSGAVKDWKSRLTVLEKGAPVLTRTIEVNHPLKYKGAHLFQSSYGWNWDEVSLVLRVRKNDDPSFQRDLELRIGAEADVPGMELKIAAKRFVPDFVIDDRNEVQSRSFEPNNPAVLVEGRMSGRTVLSGWLFTKYPEFNRVRDEAATGFILEFREVKAEQFSVLQAAYDPGAPLIWLGCGAVMFGLFLAFYWPPREIRAAIEVKKAKTEAVLTGRASKSGTAVRNDIEAVIAAVRRGRS